MNIENVVVTPAMAANLLAKNKGNRVLKPWQVAKWATEMRAGRWKFNGDSIRVDECGYILDGQHRLHAVVQTGIPMECILITGLPREVFTTIDVGAKKSGSDTLGCLGVKNANRVASALPLIDSILTSPDHGVNKYRGNRAPSNDCTRALWEKYLSGFDLPEVYKKCGRRLSPGVAVAIYYLFSSVNQHSAEVFFTRLGDGAGLEIDSPILKLRNLLDANERSNKKYSRETVIALTIKAWNAFSRRYTIKNLSYRGGENEERFPLIAGLEYPQP